MIFSEKHEITDIVIIITVCIMAVAVGIIGVYTYYKSYEAPQTRSKTKAKTNPGNDKMLTEIIVKKNKNYLKNNKRKEYKNVWSRRLRQKLVT